MLSLCAIALDGMLGANWPALRPWGLLRIGFMVVMMIWCARAAWEEAHTRRSNVDLIAAVLEQKASEGDLIVVQDRVGRDHVRPVLSRPGPLGDSASD